MIFNVLFLVGNIMLMNIHTAIAHNEKTMTESPKKGMIIEREIFFLHLIAKETL
tara:strand:- start:71 stop:232 length:162 start_codon:yes stop_codon:yes gene_type:complete